ncbi:hypothetical protein B0T16DRAFT_453364 [Cercophora newfieldiana]|uniref:Uncharacterized protein n=1 Tax=Cercophora newfieldiana TaxID=92897 RepID=A0AA40D152_9PEZI|nr:hypothetical protein B0T16DRAFT_453364 [Cercophora newfieldiana]
MTVPANAAIREQRRRSTPLDIEQMNVMKAMTAAEYSRRQFVLNFAASRDTRLLIPGQKAEATKEAEEWAVAYLNQNGFSAVTNDLFKYTVDARLWDTLVGDEVEFPFAFMRRADESSTSTITNNSQTGDSRRPMSGIFPAGYEVGMCRLDQVLTRDSQPELPPARRPSTIEKQERATKSPSPQPTTSQTAIPQTSPPPQRQRSSKKKDTSEGTTEKRRSLSMYGFEDLKMTKKLNQDKFPLLVRWGRSFSRRMSG